MSRLLQHRDDKLLSRESAVLSSRVVPIAVGLYILVVLVASFHFNISLTPDRVILLLLIAGLATGRVRQFLKDWTIFLVVLIAWQVLTGYSHALTKLKPHVTEMITVDRWIFHGTLPTLWLQQHLYNPHRLSWWDIGASVLYMMHFVFPMAVAFALWLYRRPAFVEFMGSFLILALAGFATFAFYPAAPPWMAANWWHYFPHVYRIFNAGINYFGGQQSFTALYQFMWDHGGWDRVGAVPSEHAAFPFLCFLYARQAWHRGGWILLPYCAAVWVAVVYLGEHYVTDVIVGVVYATIAYGAVQFALRRQRRRVQADQVGMSRAVPLSDSASV